MVPYLPRVTSDSHTPCLRLLSKTFNTMGKSEPRTGLTRNSWKATNIFPRMQRGHMQIIKALLSRATVHGQGSQGLLSHFPGEGEESASGLADSHPHGREQLLCHAQCSREPSAWCSEQWAPFLSEQRKEGSLHPQSPCSGIID